MSFIAYPKDKGDESYANASADTSVRPAYDYTPPFSGEGNDEIESGLFTRASLEQRPRTLQRDIHFMIRYELSYAKGGH